MADSGVTHAINLSFEAIKLPPFQDILILARNSHQGKIGLSRSFELLVPNGFDVVEVNEGNVEALFINRRITRKISVEKVISVLRKKVFPYVSEGELIKVSFSVRISYSTFEEADS